MEALSLDNILNEDQVNVLFGPSSNDEETPEKGTSEKENIKDNSEEITTTEVAPEELFGEPESVGSGEDILGNEGTIPIKDDTSSDFYSSIANALVEDGILQDLSEEDLSKIKTAEDFAETISAQIKNQLDERLRRVDEALGLGIEPSEIQKYERYLATLESITDARLSSEEEEGENLRKNIIYQDYINKGYSQDRALKMVERSFNAGTDIEDAKEALRDNKDFFNKLYKELLQEAKQEEEQYKQEVLKQANKLKTSILEEETAFGDLTIDKATRLKVYDSVCKPIYKDPNTGTKLTAIQKYELENRADFIKNVGLLYVLTDGFKNIDKLVTNKVKKETKKSLRNLEHTLKGGQSFRGGNLTFANNSASSDPESLFKGWKLSV